MKKLWLFIYLLTLLILETGTSYSGTNKSIEVIKHEEIIYKDLTGDGVEEKLVFAYSGPDIRLLDISFRIYQVDPKAKKETKIYCDKWKTEDIYDNPFDPDFSEDRFKRYLSGFFDNICYDSSKNNLCQGKCLGSLWCKEEEIKGMLEGVLRAEKLKKHMGEEKYIQWVESLSKTLQEVIEKKNKDPDFDKNYKLPIWKEFDKKVESMSVEREEVTAIFQEIFKEKDISCFVYKYDPEYREIWVWSPGLKKFISVGGCH